LGKLGEKGKKTGPSGVQRKSHHGKTSGLPNKDARRKKWLKARRRTNQLTSCKIETGGKKKNEIIPILGISQLSKTPDPRGKMPYRSAENFRNQAEREKDSS